VFDEAVHRAEVAHAKRRLAAAVEFNSGANAADLRHQLHKWGAG